MKRPEKYHKIQWSIVITGEFTHRYCYISLIIEGIMKGILFNISSLYYCPSSAKSQVSGNSWLAIVFLMLVPLRTAKVMDLTRFGPTGPTSNLQAN